MRYDAVFAKGDTGQDVILIVCPTSHDMQGRRMTALAAAIRKKFNLTALYLADGLDDHNLGDPNAASGRGDDWLTRHAALLPAVPVTRWADIRGDVTFSARLEQATSLYNGGGPARRAIDDICGRHALRLLSRRGGDLSAHFLRSVSYMIEEVAGLSIIRDRTAAPEVYPGETFADPDILRPLKIPQVIPVSFFLKARAA